MKDCDDVETQCSVIQELVSAAQQAPVLVVYLQHDEKLSSELVLNALKRGAENGSDGQVVGRGTPWFRSAVKLHDVDPSLLHAVLDRKLH